MKKLSLMMLVLFGILVVGAFIYSMHQFAIYVHDTIEAGLQNLTTGVN